MNGSTPSQTSDRFIIPPGKNTTDTLWYLILAAFVAVFLVSVFTLLAGFFASGWTQSERGPVVGSDTVYAIFTLVAGALAGLLAPSPITQRARSDSRGIPEASQRTANIVWLVIVGALALILVAATVALVVGFFTAGPNDSFSVGMDKILALATAVTGFLAGFLSPSPVAT